MSAVIWKCVSTTQATALIHHKLGAAYRTIH